MKKFILVVLVLGASATLSFAQQADTTKANTSAKAQDGVTKIRIEELPEPVKQALEDEAFKGWMINAAFHDTRKDEYRVDLKNGVEKQSVRFNKEGKRLKG